MKEKVIIVKDYLTKSNLPSSDYVINPYVGCPHACKYCYACFMKRFTNHLENWGDFLDIKQCDMPISLKKLKGKRLFLSSVTDCYHPLEEKYQITKKILEQLKNAECQITISTKSKLILRDLKLLRDLKDLTVSISINTLDENFRQAMDHASSISDRIHTLKVLHENGIRTVLFMSPIFPYITDFKSIIECTKDFVDEYWFENLNLRGSYKAVILNYIKQEYPMYFSSYIDIYDKKNSTYWTHLANQINEFCQKENITFQNYFYHEKLVKEKKEIKK